MQERLVTVATVQNSVEAGLLKNLLEAEGIAAFVAEETASVIGLPGVSAGLTIQVPEKHAGRARSLLARHAPRGLAQGPVIRKGRRYRQRPAASEPAETSISERAFQPPAKARTRACSKDGESQQSQRERDASRAFRAAVSGLLCPFLLPFLEAYALYLLIRVVAARGPLDRRARRAAWWTAAINAAILGSAVFLAIAIVTPPSPVDLTALRHPDRMRGVWERVLPEEEGGGIEEIHLDGKGLFRIRVANASPFAATGTWGYESQDYCILFRIDEIEQGDLLPRGKLFSMPVHEVKDNELRLGIAHGVAIYKRR